MSTDDKSWLHVDSSHGFSNSGLWWPSVMHYIIAHRFVDPTDVDDVRAAETVSQALSVGLDESRAPIVTGWEEDGERREELHVALRCKYRQHTSCSEQLLREGSLDGLTDLSQLLGTLSIEESPKVVELVLGDLEGFKAVMEQVKAAIMIEDKMVKNCEDVRFFSDDGPFGAFANFYPRPFTVGGVTYATNEHFFQAQKFIGSDKDVQEVIEQRTPKLAAKAGRDRSRPLRSDWETVKLDLMRQGLHAKFSQHDDLKQLLLSTGDRNIVERSPKDNYWGDGGDGSGKNMLGELLMEVRGELRGDKNDREEVVDNEAPEEPHEAEGEGPQDNVPPEETATPPAEEKPPSTPKESNETGKNEPVADSPQPASNEKDGEGDHQDDDGEASKSKDNDRPVASVEAPDEESSESPASGRYASRRYSAIVTLVDPPTTSREKTLAREEAQLDQLQEWRQSRKRRELAQAAEVRKKGAAKGKKALAALAKGSSLPPLAHALPNTSSERQHAVPVGLAPINRKLPAANLHESKKEERESTDDPTDVILALRAESKIELPLPKDSELLAEKPSDPKVEQKAWGASQREKTKKIRELKHFRAIEAPRVREAKRYQKVHSDRVVRVSAASQGFDYVQEVRAMKEGRKAKKVLKEAERDRKLPPMVVEPVKLPPHRPARGKITPRALRREETTRIESAMETLQLKWREEDREKREATRALTSMALVEYKPPAASRTLSRDELLPLPVADPDVEVRSIGTTSSMNKSQPMGRQPAIDPTKAASCKRVPPLADLVAVSDVMCGPHLKYKTAFGNDAGYWERLRAYNTYAIAKSLK